MKAKDKKKTKMELQDPRVFESFIQYVLALQDPSRELLQPELLRRLTRLLIRHPVYKDGQVDPFTIDLKEAAELYVYKC